MRTILVLTVLAICACLCASEHCNAVSECQNTQCQQSTLRCSNHQCICVGSATQTGNHCNQVSDCTCTGSHSSNHPHCVDNHCHCSHLG